MPVRASRKEVSVHWRAVCHPSLTISISIHVPYGLRTHLEPIVHTTDIKIPIISLSLHALTGRSQSSTMAALSLSNSLQLMMRRKKVCQITWTFKLQNIALCSTFPMENTQFNWSNNCSSFEMISCMPLLAYSCTI